MAIVSCKLRLQGAKLKIGSNYSREYTHEYLVVTNDPEALMGTVVTQAALFVAAGNDPFPSLWDSYDVRDDSDPGSFLQDIDVSRLTSEDNDFYHWLITCVWKTPKDGNGATAQPAADPTNDPIKWHAEVAQFTRRVSRDVDDDRLLANAAGDLYDDIEKDDGRIILVASKNIAKASFGAAITQMRTYSNSVNNATFLSQAKATCKMDSIAMSQLQSREGIDYYTLTYRIQLCADHEDNWHLVLENKGSMAWTGTGTDAQKVRVKVLEGPHKGEFKDFAYLDNDGMQLEDSGTALPWPPVGDEPYHIYPEKDWSTLGLSI